MNINDPRHDDDNNIIVVIGRYTTDGKEKN